MAILESMRYMNNHWALGFAFNSDLTKIVLITKNRPAWQRGKLNGIGGGIEQADLCSSTAMAREFEEEAGVLTTPAQWIQFLTMESDNWQCDCFCTQLSDVEMSNIKSCTDETVAVYSIDDIQNQLCVTNCKWIIYMAIDKLANNEFRRATVIY